MERHVLLQDVYQHVGAEPIGGAPRQIRAQVGGQTPRRLRYQADDQEHRPGDKGRLQAALVPYGVDEPAQYQGVQ
jgi:hypothetical protein